MKLSQLTLNGSFTMGERDLHGEKSLNVEAGYETPKKNNLTRFLHQQSASTLARTNSAGPKTFIKRVSKMKNEQPLSKKSSIKQITSQQDKQHISPFNKNCFQKSNRPLMSIDSIKRINFGSNSKKKKDHLLESRFQSRSIYRHKQQKNLQNSQQQDYLRLVMTQRKHYMSEYINDKKNSNNHFINKINNTFTDPATDNTTTCKTIQPTNYTSVKLFMSTKFKKGIRQKIPVNLLAVPESIHEKQTSSQLSVSQVSHNRLLQTVLVNGKKRFA